MRYRVLERDAFACRYCGARPPNSVLVIDHVQPLAAGGTDFEDNLCAACEECNAGKSDSAPIAYTPLELMRIMRANGFRFQIRESDGALGTFWNKHQNREAMNFWRPLIHRHKGSIIALLRLETN